MALRRSTGLKNKLGGAATVKSTNGDFSGGTAGWTAGLNTTFAVTSGVATATASTTTTDGTIYQDIATVVGKLYRVQVMARNSVGITGCYITAAGTRSATLTGSTFTNRTFAFIAVDTSTRVTFGLIAGVVSDSAEFKSASVQEVSEGFSNILAGGFINVYTGAQPASADDAATGTLLYTLSKDGAGIEGLHWELPASGAIAKKVGEMWRGTALVGGQAGWFRFYEAGTNPAVQSTAFARFDGTISTSGSSEITMANTTVDVDSIQSLTAFTYNQAG